MKVLFITPKYSFGGAERQMSILMKGLAKKGVEVTLLDLETKNKIDLEFNVKQFKKNFLDLNKPIFFRMLGRIKKYFEISKFIHKGNYNYVIFFNLNLLPLVFFSKKKMIYSVREYNPKIFDSKIISFFLKKLTLITTNNFPSYILLERKYKNVLFQNNVIDFEINKKSYIEKKKKNYLIVSNFSERKNILPAVETFISLKDEGYKLRIAGKVVDEKYFKRIKKIIEKNGENIEILGFLNHEELEREYLKSEGIIHLSKLEGTPNALLDAIKYKKKFIALKTPENLSLFLEAKEFLISENKDLSKALKNITQNDYTYLLDSLYSKFKKIYNTENINLFYLELTKIGD